MDSFAKEQLESALVKWLDVERADPSLLSDHHGFTTRCKGAHGEAVNVEIVFSLDLIHTLDMMIDADDHGGYEKSFDLIEDHLLSLVNSLAGAVSERWDITTSVINH